MHWDSSSSVSGSWQHLEHFGLIKGLLTDGPCERDVRSKPSGGSDIDNNKTWGVVDEPLGAQVVRLRLPRLSHATPSTGSRLRPLGTRS